MKIEFSAQPVECAAPYLHWCKTRIQRLMADGNESEAVELSTKSNLVCGLTAFVAWDESEKVSIADHALVQPCLYDRLISNFAGSQAAAGEVVFMRQARLGGGAGFLDQTFGATATPDDKARLRVEQKLKDKLSNICRRARVTDWKNLVKAIFKWVAEGSGDERWRRCLALQELMIKIEQHAASLSSLGKAKNEAQFAEEAKQIHQLLTAFVDQLPAKKGPSWMAKMGMGSS